jgi:small-conductance mechanosensitive channel
MVNFPNSLVLQQPIFNYSTSGSFIWDEISLNLSYESSLKFIEKRVKEVLKKYFQSDDLKKPIRKTQRIISNSFISDLEIDTRPSVIFIPNPYGWIQAKISYLVHIKKMTETKNQLTKLLISDFKKYPEKIKFPKGQGR